jgi:hypothetical protein
MTDEKFLIQFTLDDFELMTHTSCKSFYSEQAERFEWINSEQFGKEYSDDIDLQAECIATDPEYPHCKSDQGWYMYWLGDNALNAIVGERILQAAGHTVYRLWDLRDDAPEWCLLSNYQGKGWKD